MRPPDPGFQLINDTLLESLLEQAQRSPRRRVNYNFHASPEENPNRFLNVMLYGSYFTPHRHFKPAKHENFLLLDGELAFFIFDDGGAIKHCQILSGGGPVRGIDIAPGVWHTLVVLSEHCLCFETKPGPYVASTDKEFAPWAPHEGQPECGSYEAKLLDYALKVKANGLTT